MTPSVNNIVSGINETLSGILPGMKVNGIANIVFRDDKVMPVNADGVYVGVDDAFPLIIYHRIGSLTTSLRAVNTYGDSRADVVNSYNMLLVVYNISQRTGLRSEDLMLLIQGNLPQTLANDFYKHVHINLTGGNLNDRQVWAQEYGDTGYRLKDGHNLFQINYTLETVFKKGCFVKCPEDLKIKN